METTSQRDNIARRTNANGLRLTQWAAGAPEAEPAPEFPAEVPVVPEIPPKAPPQPEIPPEVPPGPELPPDVQPEPEIPPDVPPVPGIPPEAPPTRDGGAVLGGVGDYRAH